MTCQASDINQPDVVAEITALFHDYEAALMRNDVDRLNAFFWNNPAVTRYGIADRQLGHGELVAYRQSVPPPDFTRTLEAIRVSTFGPDVAVAMCEFRRSDTELHGYQTQTWIRLPEGWKIVSAHVSMVPRP